MLGLMYFALVTDFGQYELIIFRVGGVALSAAAVAYQRKIHPSER